MAEHFDITAWADFLRGLKSGADKKHMQAHLDEPCQRCRSALNLLTATRDALIAGPSPEVPEDVVQRAEAIFPKAAAKMSRWKQIAAVLAFDSYANALPAGVRGGGGDSRQLLYRAANVEIDLRIELHPRSAAAIIGQIGDARSESPFGNCQVLLVSGARVLEETASNEFGEFALSCQRLRGLRLRFSVESERLRIDLPLGPLLTNGNAGAKTTTTKKRSPRSSL